LNGDAAEEKVNCTQISCPSNWKSYESSYC
jgi:hypothetical protein